MSRGYWRLNRALGHASPLQSVVRPIDRYTRVVRFVLAMLMAAMLAVVTTSDRVACLDGCSDKAPHEGSSTTPSVCGLCHGWRGPLPINLGSPVALPVVTMTPVTSRELPAHLASLDHPPKLA